MTGENRESDPADDAPSALHAAVQLADLIRTTTMRHRHPGHRHRHHHHPAGISSNDEEQEKTEDDGFSSWWIPGMTDGVIAGGLIFAVLTPVRAQLLRPFSGRSWGMFPDLVVSSAHVITASMAAIYMGIFQGSRVYLKQLGTAKMHHPTNLEIGKVSRGGGGDFQESDRAAAAVVAKTTWVQEVCHSPSVLHWLSIQHHSKFTPPDQLYGWSQDPRRQTLEAFGAALETCRSVHHSEQKELAASTTTTSTAITSTSTPIR